MTTSTTTVQNDPNWASGAWRLQSAAGFGVLGALLGVVAAWEVTAAAQLHHALSGPDLIRVIIARFSSAITEGGAVLGAAIGALVGWRLSYRPAEIHIRGTQLAKNVRELRHRGADGIAIHPDVRLTESQETAHIMLLGGSGSGKTSILWPILEQIRERGDKALVFSFKGDFQERWGDNRFALLEPCDARSSHWLLGHDIRTRLDAEALAQTLIPEPDKDPIWAQGAQALLVAVVADLQTKHGERWGYALLAQSTARALSDYDALLETVMRESPIARAYLMGKDSKTTASFLAQMATGLGSVMHLGVAEDAAGQGGRVRRWSVRAWLDGKTPPVAIMGFRPSADALSRAFASSVIEQAVRQVLDMPDVAPHERRMWLIIDEAPQAGKIPSITQALEAARSKGMRVILGLQGTQQIEKTYDAQTRATWAGMTATKVVARLQEPDDQKWASSLLGEREVERYQATQSVGVGGGGSSAGSSYQRVREPVMLPAQFETDLYSEYPRRVRALLMNQSGRVVADWPFPAQPHRRAAFKRARWICPGYKRPAWGTVPPRVAEPASSGGAENGGRAGGEKTGPGVAARSHNQPAAGTVLAQQSLQPEAVTNADEIAADVGEEVITEAGAEALDAVAPGAGTAVSVAHALSEAFGASGSASAAAPAPAQRQQRRIADAEQERE